MAGIENYARPGRLGDAMRSIVSACVEQLYDSFEMVIRNLRVARLARRVVVALLFVHSCLLAYSAYVHSPTIDEPAHLAAGLSHWEFGQFALYKVNPPLVRSIASLPVIVVGYRENWLSQYDAPGARPEFNVGHDFVLANGERSLTLMMIARWACIPFSWIGAIVCYLWARDLYGRPAGVFACALWCFEPNIIAHASLITPDAHAAALGLAACYTLWRWLMHPTWPQTVVVGVALGLAELAKTTLIVFIPLWPLIWLAFRWPDRDATCGREWARQAGMLALQLTIGLYVLNLGYGLEGSFRRLQAFHFVSELFTGSSTDVLSDTSIPAPVNRFAGTWLGRLPVPLPSNYLLGIDIQQVDFEDEGRPSYLRGQVRYRGWWYYYLYAVVTKVPLGYWLLAGLIVALRWRRVLPQPSSRVEFMILAPPLILFAVVSVHTGFTEHMRYVLPCFPFLFVFLSQSANAISNFHGATFESAQACPSNSGWQYFDETTPPRAMIRTRGSSVFFSCTVCISMAWSIGSSLWIYPHHLSYFNELVGGPHGGPQHLLGSNCDWGQDLDYLGRWMTANRYRFVHHPLYLAYCGSFNPADVGYTGARTWPGDFDASVSQRTGESTKESTRNGVPTAPGYYAVSANFLYGLPSHMRDGLVRPVPILQGDRRFEWCRSIKPIASAGYSILIYHLDDE